MAQLNLSKLGLPQSEIECTDEPCLFPNICDQFSYLKCVFENLVIRVGCFVPQDLVSWDVFSWDVCSVHRWILPDPLQSGDHILGPHSSVAVFHPPPPFRKAAWLKLPVFFINNCRSSDEEEDTKSAGEPAFTRNEHETHPQYTHCTQHVNNLHSVLRTLLLYMWRSQLSNLCNIVCFFNKINFIKIMLSHLKIVFICNNNNNKENK